MRRARPEIAVAHFFKNPTTKPKETKIKKIHSAVLVNAAEMGRAHPKTFDYPPKEMLDQIQPGNLVKVSDVELPERFWVRITQRKGDVFVGKIDNHFFWDKPYDFGSLIRFGTENVYDFWLGPDEELHKLEKRSYK